MGRARSAGPRACPVRADESGGKGSEGGRRCCVYEVQLSSGRGWEEPDCMRNASGSYQSRGRGELSFPVRCH